LCDKSEAAQKANDDERRRWRRSHKNAAIYLLIYAQQWEVGGWVVWWCDHNGRWVVGGSVACGTVVGATHAQQLPSKRSEK